ncbi:alpha-L-fucosidase [Iamia sp. SCSIO 61187]|uniref:alpha-L-fucosidase n=1 Tax=Iamia sp. SCSIO 61187 TaxID=2722752 RepID=UPI001C636E5E|nr:alpha-L-fucosidase [Iamia sp. SCSIO 61187]QYG95257.1 alpha-L-fucosidase [Iamia sp. SCSIO 61187]
MSRRRDQRIPGHRTPPWFDDAKLGIFVHWGLFSVPAWAPVLPPGQTMLDLLRQRPGDLGAQLPYAEWYANALRIPGSPTARHHAATYGDAPYEDFRVPFEAGLDAWDPDAWADRFARSGAGYVVLVTKHHDGYLLWPSDVPNPRRPGWHAPRDVVGELAAAVRRRGLRFGTYYSVGLDWTWEDLPIREPADGLACIPSDPGYVAYVDAHLRELVDRYEPSVVWSDIGAPAGFDLRAFLVDYLRRVPDGTINDRWRPPPPGLQRPRVRSAVNATVRAALPRLPETGSAPGHPLADFRTPEYDSPPAATDHRWEATRGMGAAFGYNRAEPDDRLIDPDDLVRSLVDMVAKNGNLLLNVGPDADGTILAREATRLGALGGWMDVAGEALVGTRPWVEAAGTTEEGVDVRFTQRDGALYAVLLATPSGAAVTLPGLAPLAERPVTLLGHGDLTATAWGHDLVLAWPHDVPPAAAHAVRIGLRSEAERWQSGRMQSP